MRWRVASATLLYVAVALAASAQEQAFWVHGAPRAVRAVMRPPARSSIRPASRDQRTLDRTKAQSKLPAVPASPVPAEATISRASLAQQLATGSSSPWSVAVGLTLLTLVPAILLAMTPLVRLLVVFHFLRQALGTQTAPSNQILMALGLMMTWFLMQPVITQVNAVAIAPYRAGTMSGEDALERGAQPVKSFMLRYARDKDLELFAAASQSQRMTHREEAPMQVVVPAYMLSELKSGFQIGAILFLPFLLVDLVVASVTTSIGMLQMPPTVVSTPVKILLFVMVDGWHLLASSLLKSF